MTLRYLTVDEARNEEQFKDAPLLDTMILLPSLEGKTNLREEIPNLRIGISLQKGWIRSVAITSKIYNELCSVTCRNMEKFRMLEKFDKWVNAIEESRCDFYVIEMNNLKYYIKDFPFLNSYKFHKGELSLLILSFLTGAHTIVSDDKMLHYCHNSLSSEFRNIWGNELKIMHGRTFYKRKGLEKNFLYI